MRRHIFLIAVFILSAVCSRLAAQQLDVNGPNAVQKLQGKIASIEDPVGHAVEVTLPGTFVLNVTSGANPFAGISTIMSTTAPTAGVLPTPWGGSIDLGVWDPNVVITQITVLGDGITYTGISPVLDQFWRTDGGDPANGIAPQFTFSLSVTPALLPQGETLTTRTFQSIVADPTNAPFNLDNTEVGQANFRFGQEAVLLTGEDGFVTVDFLPGSTFNFHGQTYSQVHVHANGYVTFGGPGTLPDGGANNDHQAWLSDRPAIAALLTDWSPNAHDMNDGVFYEERGSLVRIAWGDPRAQSLGGISHATDTDSNQFEIILELDNGLNPNEGRFAINFTGLDLNAQVGLGRGLLGHTPGGMALLGGAWDTDLRSQSQAAGPGTAQIEEHDPDGSNASNLGWDGMGQLRIYNNLTLNWDGALLIFDPQATTGITGSAGYVSTPPAFLPPDDVQNLSIVPLANEGNELLFISGSFFGFDPMGTGAASVVFDPQGAMGGPFPATLINIGDSTGQCGPLSTANPQPSQSRDGQVLVVLTPFFGGAAGTYDMQVSFASGFVKTVPAQVGAPTLFYASYLQNDDDYVTHNLSVPVTLYGQTHNTLHVGSNGYVTFAAGANINSGGVFSMNSGYGTPGNPSVAALFTDLNPLGMAGPSTYEILEDATLGTVQVVFRYMYYWTTNEPAGTVVITFGDNGPNCFSLDLTGVMPTVAGTQDVCFGVSNGDLSTPLTDLSNGMGTGLFNLLPAGGGTGYLSAAPGDSVAECFPRNLPLPFTQPIQFTDQATSAPWGLWFIQ